MEVSLKYGHIEEKLEVPEEKLIAVVRSPVRAEPLPDGDKLVQEALESPVGSPRLREMARGKQRVAVIISDHTRPTPSGRLLPFLLAELEAGGIGPQQVAVVVASGLHDRADEAMLQKLLGRDLLHRVQVVVHNPDDMANLVDLGFTTRGTPVKVNRVVAEADLVASVSTVEPHLLYGWSGGAKNVLPGVSWRQTVYVHHGRHRTDPGGLDKVEGNNFREDAEEAGRMAGLGFILNVMLSEKRELVGAFAGDPVAAHRAAVVHARRYNVVPIPEMADVVLCAMGGSPRDGDFWQAQGKGIMHTGHVIRDGGVLILAVGCELGVGAKGFKDLCLVTMDEIERWYNERDYSVPLMKAFDMVALLRRAGIYLVSPGVGPADFPQLPIRFFPTVAAALERAMEERGGKARVLVVPDSSRVVVSLSE